MRRFVTLAVLLFFSIPFGASLVGCHHAVAPTYCNGQNSGIVVGQLTSLDLEPRLTGISLNQGEIGHVNSPSGKDCRGDSASPSNVVYASTNITLADVAPTNGSLCAGSWNRNTGGAIPDYTVCTPAAVSGVAYITTTADGVVSNPVAVFVHPVVTSIVLGATGNCTSDPGSNCVDLAQTNGCDNGATLAISRSALNGGVATFAYTVTPSALILNTAPAVGQIVNITGTTNANGTLNVTNAAITSVTGNTFTVGGFSTATNFPAATESGTAVTSILSTTTSTIPVYAGNACISQGSTAQLVARSYYGNGTTSAFNISCLVGPLQFNSTNASIVTIDANGVATAAQPGAATITAAISQASSTAGFFSTCPPASITLSIPPSTTVPTVATSVNQNTTQPLVATVVDTKGVSLTNVPLQYISTTPTTIPTAGADITPTFPGQAAITAICQPPTCNPSPFNEIGLFGNGSPVTSNPVQIAATGTNFSTNLYIASTNSQYLLPVDFTQTTQLPPVRLPYVPNSMVISQDNSTIYMGNSYEIMQYSTASNAVIKQDTTVAGNVLAISNDNSTLVVSDPVRQLIYLYLGAGGVSTEYGGVATSAQFSPDSATVYITTTDGRLLVHSNFTGWSAITLPTAPTAATGVAVTVPQAGVYIASNPVDVRTNCPATTITGAGLQQTTINTFYPDLGPVAGANDSLLAATNDGLHILGANGSSFTDIQTNRKSGACPVTFNNTPIGPLALAGVATAATTTAPYIYPYGVTNVLATSDSAYAFVTYNGTGGVLPQYTVPTTAGTNGTLSNIRLQGTATAPVAGVISADNKTLYVGTEGDNLVHILIRGTGGFTDPTTSVPINPALPAATGTGIATPNLLVQHPRKATS